MRLMDSAQDMGTNEKPRQKVIESSSLFKNADKVRPMSNFRTSPSDFLDEIVERSACHLCLKSRRYFCYSCCVPLDNIKDKIPRLVLPVDIDIIKHPLEVDGKSTAIHAAVLAPDHVKVHMYPNIPDYRNLNVALVFPGAEAVTLKELWKKEVDENELVPCSCYNEGNNRRNRGGNFDIKHISKSFHTKLPLDKIVFIDSTWRQTRKICSDERLQGIPNIKLTSHESLFWRHQRNKPLCYLATIEAVYYFLVELDELLHESTYSGHYDDIMFFFKYMYQKIRCVYDPRIAQLLAEGCFINSTNTS